MSGGVDEIPVFLRGDVSRTPAPAGDYPEFRLRTYAHIAAMFFGITMVFKSI